MEYFKRLGNFWFQDLNAFAWLLFLLPALYFFQTTIHEGTHAMAALFETGNFPTLAPFPHETAAGDFLNGVALFDPSVSVTVTERLSCNNPTPESTSRLAGFIGAPQFVAFFLITVFSLVIALVPVSNPVIRFVIRAWYLGACIDFMYNTARALGAGCNDGADWSRFMYRSDIDPAAFAGLTWVLWLGILSHFVWIYWSRWGRENADNTGFWDYRWLALSFALLSLTCVILSATVGNDEPRIVKDSAAFIVPLVVQCLAFVWYALYFVLTYTLSAAQESRGGLRESGAA